MAIDYPIRFGKSHDQDSVRIKVINALSTRQGERVFRINNGTNIEEQLNKSTLSSAEIKRRISEELENVLAQEVPSITVENISVNITQKNVQTTIIYNPNDPFNERKSSIQITYAQSK